MHQIHKQESDAESESVAEQDLDDVIPAGGRGECKMVDSTPGLSIKTKST